LLINEAQEELAQLSASEPWAEHVTYVMQVPGIGLLAALTILGAIGDICRFPTPK
jgi:transposase